MSLAVNARDAMPTGGKLTIASENVDLLEADARENLGTRAGPYVMIGVSDTGSGMDQATQAWHPVLIDQLVEMLNAEQLGSHTSQPSVSSDIGSSAARGGDLLRQGFTVDQVVHDYGDLVTELAREKDELISVDEFHTFNRCLDIAIADAVGEFGRQREHAISEQGVLSLNERLGSLAHELRNFLNTATLAFAAIKSGHVTVGGTTGAIVDRSHDGLRDLIDRALADVRLSSGLSARQESTSLDVMLEEVRVAAQLEATERNLTFTTSVESGLSILVDRQMRASALANLLQNAFKFSRPNGHISLTARHADERVLIDVADACGGLPPGRAEELFQPFEQRGGDRSGLGLGLSISRRSVEANGGTLGVRDSQASAVSSRSICRLYDQSTLRARELALW